MAGSLREKSPGVWELRVYLGRDAAGKVRHKHARFRGRKRQAERELARLVAELDAGDGDVVLDWGPETTVNDAVVGWQRNGWDDLSPSTVRRYRSIWKVHVKDDIGRRKIRSLGPYDVECYLRKLKQEGQSESSVHQIRAFLHRACRLARKWSGNRLPNPMADTDLPEWALAEKAEQVRAPELGEVRAVLAAARGYDRRVATFIRVVAASGARRGEVCALRWSDVDWDRSSVRIDEAVVADDGGVVVKGPKNRSSVRVVALDGATLDELRELRDERDTVAEACGVSVVDDGFVFSTEPSGEAAPNPDGFTHAFTRCRDLAGVAPDVHLHSLRHFQSTRLDTVISEAQKQARMGWASVHRARHDQQVIAAANTYNRGAMAKLTIEVPEDAAQRLADAAAAQGVAPEQLAGEAVTEKFPAWRKLGFVGLGHSGRSDLSGRVIKDLRRELADEKIQGMLDEHRSAER